MKTNKEILPSSAQVRLRKWLKVCFIALGVVLLVLTAGWIVFSGYVKNHRQELLQEITAKISTHVSGDVSIKDMEPALLKGFPNISVRLDSVTLIDSLYAEHHIKTLSLQSVFVRINVLSLLTNHPKIERITLSRGVIHLFTLKDGYTNTYLFNGKGKKEEEEAPTKQVSIHWLGLDHVAFIADHIPHNKRFQIDCNSIALKIKDKRSRMDIQADMQVLVHQLGFNLDKGGYLKNRVVTANIHLSFDRTKKQLSLQKQRLKIDGTPVNLSAVFNFEDAKSLLQMDIEAPVLDFAKGVSLLPEEASKKLSALSLKKPVSVNIALKGGLQYPDTPVVRASIKTQNNNIETPYGDFSRATVTAVFTNYVHPGKGKGDANSGIAIPEFEGDWMDIPIRADSVTVDNLVHPLVSIKKLTGDFPTARLNKILGSSFAVTKGNTKMQLSYEGPVMAADTYPRRMNGYLLLRHTDLTYLPRSLKFRNCNAALVFQGSELLIKTMSLQLGRSTVQIRGKGTDFLNAYFSGKEKAIFDCRLESPELNLNDFKPLLTPRRGYTSFSAATKNKQLNNFNAKLDELLDKSTMLLDLNVRRVDFNQFTAKQLQAALQIDEEAILLNRVKLHHAGGTIAFDARMRQLPHSNPFSLTADLKALKVDQLFHAFNNFGQSTLKSTNLQGDFSSELKLEGILSETAEIVPKSICGAIQFQIKNGALIDFPPFLSISKFIFKNRHLNRVTFQTLSDHLTIDSGKIHIPPMDIRSSAINMTVQGVYAFQEGTDISLQIPLRNPEKIKERKRHGLPPQKDKGITVYLRAKDGKDGKVHIGWDPLHQLRGGDTMQHEEE